MSNLPDLRRLKISQSPRRPTRQVLESLDHVVFIVPKKPSSKLLARVPRGANLKKLLARTGADLVGTRLDNGTGITLATIDASSAFERQTWARRVIAEALRDKPTRLGAFALGLDEEAHREALLSLTAAAEAAAFRLPSFKSDGKRQRRLTSLRLLGCDQRLDLTTVNAQALGNDIARWFTALPPNKLDARIYRAAVQALAKQHELSYSFLTEAQLEKLGAGAFLAVAQGNASRDAGIIRLRYRPSRQTSPDLALIGKGILFDTGGTNLKPFKSMLEMHTDMAGSAVALGTIIALAELKVPFAVDAWLAVTENRLSPDAYKSQDVVRASNGKTIQVIHTDAEGRMVLADTLALAAREGPQLMIDYATLTGSCVTALSERYSGVFSNRAAANKLLREAGVASGERVWPFPMDADFDDALKSEVADIMQCSPTASGDHILAARFLSKFVPDEIPWVHVDLSAEKSRDGLGPIPSGVTGFGVRLTVCLVQATDPSELAVALSG